MSATLNCPKCSRLHDVSTEICDCGYILRGPAAGFKCPGCARPRSGRSVCDCGYDFESGKFLPGTPGARGGLLGLLERNPWKFFIGTVALAVILRIGRVPELMIVSDVLFGLGVLLLLGAFALKRVPALQSGGRMPLSGRQKAALWGLAVVVAFGGAIALGFYIAEAVGADTGDRWTTKEEILERGRALDRRWQSTLRNNDCSIGTVWAIRDDAERKARQTIPNGGLSHLNAATYSALEPRKATDLMNHIEQLAARLESCRRP